MAGTRCENGGKTSGAKWTLTHSLNSTLTNGRKKRVKKVRLLSIVRKPQESVMRKINEI